MAQISALKANFPSDRDYTYQALIEELALLERHARDGSWLSCGCIPEKHLPMISGLSSEGTGFTDDPDEKKFMQKMMDKARIYKASMVSGLVPPEKMDEMRGWARQMRHRIEEKNWTGTYEELEVTEDEDDAPDSVKQLVDALKELETSNPLSLPEIEEDMAWRMVNHLSDKYGVPPPREIRFTDGCNPLYPNAAHIQKDVLTAKGIAPRPDLDYLVFCRGSVTAHAVAHEFDHYRKHYGGQLVADEGAANRFALKEVRNNLKKQSYTTNEGNKVFICQAHNNLHGEKGMAIDYGKGLEVGIGLTVAKLVDQYDGWFETQFPGYAQSAKVAAGAVLSYLSLDGRLPKGWISDIALFGGMELIITEVMKFLPGGTTQARIAAAAAAPMGPMAIPGAPGRAVITSASPYTRMYTTPTRLTSGYPQVAQVDSKWLQVRV